MVDTRYQESVYGRPPVYGVDGLSDFLIRRGVNPFRHAEGVRCFAPHGADATFSDGAPSRTVSGVAPCADTGGAGFKRLSPAFFYTRIVKASNQNLPGDHPDRLKSLIAEIDAACLAAVAALLKVKRSLCLVLPFHHPNNEVMRCGIPSEKTPVTFREGRSS